MAGSGNAITYVPGTTLNPGRLNGSPGVTTFLKVTALGLDVRQLLLQAVLLLGPALSHGPAKLILIWFPCALVALSCLPKEDSFNVARCKRLVYCVVCIDQ